MDYSRKKTLSFQARGDGRQYTVMFLGRGRRRHPADVSASRPAPSGSEVRIRSRTLAGIDSKRVRGIGIGTHGPLGAFRFEIDDVRAGVRSS